MTTLHKMKASCKSCGWHIVSVSDCLRSIADRVSLCGECGGTDLVYSDATFIESVNPFSTIKYIAYKANAKGTKN